MSPDTERVRIGDDGRWAIDADDVLHRLTDAA
jgi:hypothetical protein